METHIDLKKLRICWKKTDNFFIKKWITFQLYLGVNFSLSKTDFKRTDKRENNQYLWFVILELRR